MLYSLLKIKTFYTVRVPRVRAFACSLACRQLPPSQIAPFADERKNGARVHVAHDRWSHQSFLSPLRHEHHANFQHLGNRQKLLQEQGSKLLLPIRMIWCTMKKRMQRMQMVPHRSNHVAQSQMQRQLVCLTCA